MSVDATGQIRVNFSDEEAASEGREFTPVPSGKYHIKFTDIELKECGPNSNNPGKPYYHVETTVQDGEYENRKLWTNAMLFEGALYTIGQMCKSIGREDAIESGIIPPADDFIGEDASVNVKKQLDSYAMEKEGTEDKLYKNEIKSFMPWDGNASPSTGTSKGSKGGSLLP